MGLLYKIAKWSVNKLIKKGVDLTDLVETDEHTQKIRGVAHRLNDDMVMLQNDFSMKRAEIIELQDIFQFQSQLPLTQSLFHLNFS